MTELELQEIQDWIDSLEGDAKEGAMAALNRILVGRMGGGGSLPGMPKPPEVDLPVDPELEEPEDEPFEKDDEGEDDDIDDPEDLLKSKDTKDPEDDSDDGEEKDKGDKGKEADPEEETKSKKGEGEEEVEDDDEDIDDRFKDDDAEIADKKKNEKFRRRVEAASAISQLRKALEKLAQEKGDDSSDIDTDDIMDAEGADGEKSDKKASETDAETSYLETLLDELQEIADDLKEDPDAIDKMSTKDFDEKIAKALEAVEKTGISRVMKVDRASHLKKLSSDFGDEFANDELDQEDNLNLQKDPTFQKRKADEREAERIKAAIKNFGGFEGDIAQFKKDIEKAISQQVEEMIEVEEDSAAKINRLHDDDDMVVPGIRIDEIPEAMKPSIDVYFDQSGSWGDSEVRKGMSALGEIIKLQDQGLVVLNIWYFSTILTQNQRAARAQGGQECWDLVIDQIEAKPKTKNVVIITDSDIGYDYGYTGHHGCIRGKSCMVDGCVWWIWKNGSRVPEGPAKGLRGKRGTFEYQL